MSAIVSPGLAPATAYRQMAQIRATEERFFELYAQGLMSGTVHTSIGQEACAVGVVNAIDRSKDVIFSNHRAHGHYLAYADDVEGLVAELLGRATGVVGGIGGTQHLHIGNLYTNGIQGGIAPNAVGAALAEKLRGADAIVAVFLGDGTMGQGTVYESLNLAALWSLPLLFVLEDNQYAQSTHKRLEHAGNLSARPAAFGIPVTVIEATGVEAVFAAAQTAVAHVRSKRGPFFLALNTYRFAPHSKGDDNRSPDEIAAYRAHDPLTAAATRLSPAERSRIDAEIAARLDAAVAAALAAPGQTPATFAQQAGWAL